MTISINLYINIDGICFLQNQGSIDDGGLMERILKEHKIEVVISAVGGEKISDQHTLIQAMKAVGSVKVHTLLCDVDVYIYTSTGHA